MGAKKGRILTPGDIVLFVIILMLVPLWLFVFRGNRHPVVIALLALEALLVLAFIVMQRRMGPTGNAIRTKNPRQRIEEVERLKNAGKLRVRDCTFHSTLGNAYYELGDEAQALWHYDRARELSLDDSKMAPHGRFNLQNDRISCMIEFGRLHEAGKELPWMEEQLSRLPEKHRQNCRLNITVLEVRRDVALALSAGDYVQAREHVRRFEREQPGNLWIGILDAKVDISRGDTALTAQRLNAVISATNSPYLVNMALAMQDQLRRSAVKTPPLYEFGR